MAGRGWGTPARVQAPAWLLGNLPTHTTPRLQFPHSKSRPLDLRSSRLPPSSEVGRDRRSQQRRLSHQHHERPGACLAQSQGHRGGGVALAAEPWAPARGRGLGGGGPEGPAEPGRGGSRGARLQPSGWMCLVLCVPRGPGVALPWTLSCPGVGGGSSQTQAGPQ